MNRRGFLKGMMTAVAVVAIEIKMSRGQPALEERSLTWEEANDRYDYGIDKSNPFDVAVYDKGLGKMIDVHELHDRWADVNEDLDLQSYEATAIIAMSQGRLFWKQGREHLCVAPSYAFAALSRQGETEWEDATLPWIVTAPP